MGWESHGGETESRWRDEIALPSSVQTRGVGSQCQPFPLPLLYVPLRPILPLLLPLPPQVHDLLAGPPGLP